MESKHTGGIPAGNYEGYCWMSDATEPIVINPGDVLPELLTAPDPTRNPFVLEAMLYDPERRMSYAVKYVDGRYIITSHEVEESVEDVNNGVYDHISLKKYHAHRMQGQRLLFFQYWTERPDPLCAGFPVLEPAGRAFVGFENH